MLHTDVRRSGHLHLHEKNSRNGMVPVVLLNSAQSGSASPSPSWFNQKFRFFMTNGKCPRTAAFFRHAEPTHVNIIQLSSIFTRIAGLLTLL